MSDTEKYTYLLVQDGYHIIDENDNLIPAEELCIRLEAMEKRERWLQCLEIAGVDNWEGYNHAFDVQREYHPDDADDY